MALSERSLERPPLNTNTAYSYTPSIQVSIVIPAKNEEHNLPFVLDSLPSWAYEVILVDGHSSDNTIEVALQRLPEIRIVHQEGSGKGDALRQGFRACTGDAVIAIDADGSMDPSEIAAMVEAMENGIEYVKGSRTIGEGGSSDLTLLRRLGNWGLGTAANLLYGSKYTDLCYGFFGFRSGTIDKLPLTATGFEIETEISIMASKAKLKTVELPSFETPRLNGRSNLYPIRDGLRILRTILKHR